MHVLLLDKIHGVEPGQEYDTQHKRRVEEETDLQGDDLVPLVLGAEVGGHEAEPQYPREDRKNANAAPLVEVVAEPEDADAEVATEDDHEEVEEER